jgi:hypothetical protein
MGLDITLKEHIGYNEKGYLEMNSPDEPNWNQDRYAIRHEISTNIKLTTLCVENYDHEEYYRPSDFDKAYGWSKTLGDNDKAYIDNVLDILKKNDNYYLEFGY